MNSSKKKFKKNLLLLLFFSSILHANTLLNLDLDDLAGIEVDSTVATLTRTSQKEIPASITIMTQNDILQSGARNLDELLDIYVPSFAYMYKVHGTQMGIRGIISDRNNKILLLVNGRDMNVKASDGGAITERWFSTLGDIKKITVINGPGSAIYGSGAIAGVISIETFSGKDREGLYASTKVGYNDEFYNLELSYGSEISKNLFMYIYYGVDLAKGASEEDSAHKFAFAMDDWKHENWHLPADTNFLFKTTNDNSSFEKNLRHKLHFQLESDNFTLWARLTKSSLSTPTVQDLYRFTIPRNLSKIQDTGSQNQQITVFSEYKQKIAQDLILAYTLSYMRSDIFINYYAKNLFVNSDRSWGEDNIIAKLLLNYKINTANQIAFGSEYNYNRFGRKADIGNADISRINNIKPNTEWSSDILSFFGEYQTKVTNNILFFIGGRVDKHKYTPWSSSPRVNLVYKLTPRDIFKFNLSRSIRYSDDADLYAHKLKKEDYADYEKVDTVEFQYTRYSKHLKLSCTVFAKDHDVVAYNGSAKLIENIGNIKFYGGEFELSYQAKKISFSASHSYLKQSNFSLKDKNTIRQNISASPYGYGNDLANWNNHITKIRFNYDFSSKLQWTNSLRVYWGIPGAQDMADYNKVTNTNTKKYSMAYYDEGHTRAFEESIFLNTALIYNYNKNTTFTLHGYNLLGLIDEDNNKRNFFQRTSHYRDQAPAIAIGLKYKY
jgi:iron complex outermembrane receptor protein